MTKNTIPTVQVEWEPIPEGIIFSAKAPRVDKFTCQMPMITVREVRDDMEEAAMLARGHEKVEVMASEVEQYDKMYVGSNVLQVSDVLESRDGTVIQFGENYTEITMPSDQQITVYRRVE